MPIASVLHLLMSGRDCMRTAVYSIHKLAMGPGSIVSGSS